MRKSVYRKSQSTTARPDPHSNRIVILGGLLRRLLANHAHYEQGERVVAVIGQHEDGDRFEASVADAGRLFHVKLQVAAQEFMSTEGRKTFDDLSHRWSSHRPSSAIARIARNCQGRAHPTGVCRVFPAQFLHRRNGPLFFKKSAGWKRQVIPLGWSGATRAPTCLRRSDIPPMHRHSKTAAPTGTPGPLHSCPPPRRPRPTLCGSRRSGHR